MGNEPAGRHLALRPARVTGAPDWLVALATRLCGGPTGLAELRRRYAALPPGLDAPGLAQALLSQQGLATTLVGTLPAMAGPLAVIANHPSGLAEALAACVHLVRWRADCRFIADDVWGLVPEFRPFVIPVDARATAGSAPRNATALARALRWLRAGHVLVWFPAGAVGYARVHGGPIVDPPWPAWNARFLARSGVPVLPVHFSGGNSPLFQRVARLRPEWRHALLAREFVARQPGVIRMVVGTPLAASDPRLHGEPAAVNGALQTLITALGERG